MILFNNTWLKYKEKRGNRATGSQWSWFIFDDSAPRMRSSHFRGAI